MVPIAGRDGTAPYDIKQLDPVGYIRSALLAADAITSIASRAVRRFLGET